jgi:hypothetical protein
VKLFPPVRWISGFDFPMILCFISITITPAYAIERFRTPSSWPEFLDNFPDKPVSRLRTVWLPDMPENQTPVLNY